MVVNFRFHLGNKYFHIRKSSYENYVESKILMNVSSKIPKGSSNYWSLWTFHFCTPSTVGLYLSI